MTASVTGITARRYDGFDDKWSALFAGPFPDQPYECPDQRVYDLLVREMLRVESNSKLLNRSCQQVVLEHSRMPLLQKIVECD